MLFELISVIGIVVSIVNTIVSIIGTVTTIILLIKEHQKSNRPDQE